MLGKKVLFSAFFAFSGIFFYKFAAVIALFAVFSAKPAPLFWSEPGRQVSSRRY
ncbi:MAG: hypothetical protein IKB43_11125 [Fibrobacter sp.]|nr:hypothetical protein [Fibrobacter sp.]